MFKRANKITSLLVAAAAVVSIVPASAADVKKVDSQDGVVYNAVAYKGADLVDGTVKDNDAAYYLKDGKYTELADVDSGSDYTVYGTKYVQIDDGSDFNVDLSTGKVLDSDVASDDEDDAASALRKKIKDSDRYVDTVDAPVVVNGSTVKAYGDASIADLTVIPGNKFGEVWYSTLYNPDPANKGANAATYLNVYTDSKGNYIDADYNLGKIKVEATGVSVTIENTKDYYELVKGHKDVYATVTNSNVLGQDKDNIYRYVTLTINVPVADGITGSISVNGKSFTLNSNQVVLPVIQKISKAQASDDADDAKYAKTVTNYVISKDDASNIANLAATPGNTANDQDKYFVLANGTSNSTVTYEARMIGGKLAIFKVDNSSSNTSDNVLIQAATLKSKNGYYYVDVEGDLSTKAEYNDKLDKVAFDTDVDGNIYIIEDGYVKKFDGTDDWTKLYKVDGSMNAISSYDKDNMVTWSQEDEVYSVIGGKDATDETTTPVTTTPAVKAGWAKAADNTWSFVKADGSKATGWFQDATGTWYFAKAEGTMVAAGWAQSGSAWYYLGASGAMATNAWVQSGADWYYVGATGAMLTNTTVGGYTLGASGAWVK